ncbi:MAG TPA: hypothetical protein VGM05_18385 [Planctomycetaceae bacterium]
MSRPSGDIANAIDDFEPKNGEMNAGFGEVAGVRLLTLLEAIAKNDSIPDDVRRTAEKFRIKHKT